MLFSRAAHVLLMLGWLLTSWDACARPASPSVPRPLVFIPGILGSTLVDASGDFVWRDWLTLDRFAELEYSPGLPGTSLRSAGIMKTSFMLGAWKSGSYEPALRILRDLGFQEGVNLFTFHYDWRQSNFVIAEQLENYIEEMLSGESFNILAHSMGGIISLIYAHERPSAHEVNRIVTVGTPYLGSLKALDVFLNGPMSIYKLPLVRRHFDRHTVSKVILSFPSFFELLPVYEDCCIIETLDYGERKKASILEIDQWFAIMPAEYSRDRLRTRIENALASRVEIDKLTQDLPEDVEWVHIGGDHLRTPYQVRIKGYVQDYQWESLAAGDGTVLWESAAPYDGQIVVPTEKLHHQILEEPRVVRWINHLLVEEGALYSQAQAQEDERAANEEATRVYSDVYGRLVPLGGVGFSIGEPYKAAGDLADVVVSLVDEDRKPVPGVYLTGTVTDETEDLWTKLDFEVDGGSYRSSFLVPDRAGIYTVNVKLTEHAWLEDFFLAYERSDTALIARWGEWTGTIAAIDEVARNIVVRDETRPDHQRVFAVSDTITTGPTLEELREGDKVSVLYADSGAERGEPSNATMIQRLADSGDATMMGDTAEWSGSVERVDQTARTVIVDGHEFALSETALLGIALEELRPGDEVRIIYDDGGGGDRQVVEITKVE